MKTQRQGDILKVMAKKESVDIKVIKGEEENSKIYIMSLNVGGLNTYERAKATKRFIDNETKVLEMVLETDLREILRQHSIIPYDGSQSSLERAFAQLEAKGYTLEVRDRYYEINNEKIVGESPNHMTVILEESTLSCAMEIILHE